MALASSSCHAGSGGKCRADLSARSWGLSHSHKDLSWSVLQRRFGIGIVVLCDEWLQREQHAGKAAQLRQASEHVLHDSGLRGTRRKSTTAPTQTCPHLLHFRRLRRLAWTLMVVPHIQLL